MFPKRGKRREQRERRETEGEEGERRGGERTTVYTRGDTDRAEQSREKRARDRQRYTHICCSTCLLSLPSPPNHLFPLPSPPPSFPSPLLFPPFSLLFCILCIHCDIYQICLKIHWLLIWTYLYCLCLFSFSSLFLPFSPLSLSPPHPLFSLLSPLPPSTTYSYYSCRCVGENGEEVDRNNTERGVMEQS